MWRWLKRVFTLPASCNSLSDLLRGNEWVLVYIEERVRRAVRQKARELVGKAEGEIEGMLDRLIEEVFNEIWHRAKLTR